MKIKDIITDDKIIHFTRAKCTEDFIYKELFKAGLVGEKEKFIHFLEITHNLYNKFNFEADHYATLLHAICEWFSDEYIIMVLEDIHFPQDDISNNIKEEVIDILLRTNKIEAISYLEEKLEENEVLDRVIINYQGEGIKNIPFDTVIERWHSYKAPLGEYWHLCTSINKFIKCWRENSYQTKKAMLGPIMEFAQLIEKNDPTNFPPIMISLLLDGFIGFDYIKPMHCNNQYLSLEEMIRTQKDHLLPEAIEANDKYVYEKLQDELLLSHHIVSVKI